MTSLTKEELNLALKNSKSPLVVQLRVTGSKTSGKIQKAIQSLDVYKAKSNDNNEIDVSNDKITEPFKNKDQWAKALYSILMFFVDNGSTTKMKGSSRYIYYQPDNNKDKEYAALISKEVVLCINTYEDYTRRWLRRYADQTFDYIVAHDHNPALAVKWGVPYDYRYIAFDFADNIDIKKIKDPKMLTALNQFKASAIAQSIKEEEAGLTNASYLYHQGRIHSSGRSSRLLI